jgi:hypothetical protein
MPQVRHVNNLGGYSTLLAVARAASCPSRAADGIRQAEEMLNEGAAQHTRWIGAEPFYTQAVARKGYTGATEDTQYEDYVGDQLLTGARQRQKRIRPPLHFRARLCEAVVNRVCLGRADLLAGRQRLGGLPCRAEAWQHPRQL